MTTTNYNEDKAAAGLAEVLALAYGIEPQSHAMNRLTEAEDKLNSMLGDEGKKILETYSNTQMEINALSCTDNFLYGYKLGMLMTMEVFNGMDDLIIGGEGDE